MQSFTVYGINTPVDLEVISENGSFNSNIDLVVACPTGATAIAVYNAINDRVIFTADTVGLYIFTCLSITDELITVNVNVTDTTNPNPPIIDPLATPLEQSFIVNDLDIETSLVMVKGNESNFSTTH